MKHLKTLPAIFLSILLLAACAELKPPEYRSINNFSLKNLDSKPEFSCSVKLYNPNNLGVKVKDYSFDISIANQPVSSIHLSEATKAPANAEFTIPVDGYIPLNQIPALVTAGMQTVFSGNKIPILIKGNVVVKKFIFKKNFPLEFQQDIDLTLGGKQ